MNRKYEVLLKQHTTTNPTTMAGKNVYVSIDPKLYKRASKKAKEHGYRSLDEVVGKLLTNYVNGEIYDSEEIFVSPAAEKRLLQVVRDLEVEIERGSALIARNSDELFDLIEGFSDEEDRDITNVRQKLPKNHEK